jgi:hypothetical protein
LSSIENRSEVRTGSFEAWAVARTGNFEYREYRALASVSP